MHVGGVALVFGLLAGLRCRTAISLLHGSLGVQQTKLVGLVKT